MDFYTPFCDCGERLLHAHGAAFYVSIYDRHGNMGKGRIGLLAGPFTTHAEALRWVEPARKKAEEVNDRALWYAFGTLAMKDGYSQPGTLNHLLFSH
mgnify:FL=1